MELQESGYESDELSGNFQWLFDQGKGNLVWVRREFELFEFKLTE